jgi:hypothetical protein
VSNRRQPLIFIARDDLQWILERYASLCGRNAELGQMRPRSIDHLGPLGRYQIARAMLHRPARLLGRFDLHETCGRAWIASDIVRIVLERAERSRRSPWQS